MAYNTKKGQYLEESNTIISILQLLVQISPSNNPVLFN